MTRAPGQTVDQPPPGDVLEDDGRSRPRASPAASILTLCGFLVAMIAGLYSAAPADGPGGHVEPDRGRLAGWIVLGFLLTFGMFGG